MSDRNILSLQALRLYLWAGLSVGEIAEVLEISTANVRHLLLKPHRIRVEDDGREKSARRIKELGYNGTAEYLTTNWKRPVTALSEEIGISRERVSHLYELLALLQTNEEE